MSSQQGILNKFSSNKLWTAPSKDQYLPAYLKRICDEYTKSDNAHRVFPVECLGLQRTSDSSQPIWVIGSNLHIKVDQSTGKADRLDIADSPYCVLDSKTSCRIPTYSFEGNLAPEILRNMMNVMYNHMGSNFASTLLIIGGVGLAVHYEQLCNLFDGVPLIVAWGKPVSGKTTAAKAAMALIGQQDAVGECTLAGAIELASSRTVPFLWDDAADFTVIEKLAVVAFNQTQKKTSGRHANQSPRTVPVITMNPQVIKKTIKNDKEKIERVYSRIAVIPFNRVSPKQDLRKSMAFQTELKPLLERAIESIGVILELSTAFKTLQNDSIFDEILAMSNELSDLDMRAQFNYSLLLFSTGKILEKVGMKEEYFPVVTDWMKQAVIPNHKAIIGLGKTVASKEPLAGVPTESDISDVLTNIAKAAADNPQKVELFFKHKMVARKCGCGEALGFKVAPMLKFLNLKEEISADALRAFIRHTEIGCNGVKLRFSDGIQHHGTHIRRSALPKEILARLDSAFETMQRPSEESELVEHGSSMQSSNVKSLTESGVVNMPVDEEGTQQQQQQKQSQSQGASTVQSSTESSVVNILVNVKETQSQETESHTTRVQDCIEADLEAERKNSEQQKAPNEEFFGMSEEDIPKMDLDDEISQGAAELELEELAPIQGQVARKKKKKGEGKDEVMGLMDNIHPGIMKGKRQRSQHGKKNKKRKKKQLQSDTKFLYETNYERWQCKRW